MTKDLRYAILQPKMREKAFVLAIAVLAGILGAFVVFFFWGESSYLWELGDHNGAGFVIFVAAILAAVLFIAAARVFRAAFFEEE